MLPVNCIQHCTDISADDIKIITEGYFLAAPKYRQVILLSALWVSWNNMAHFQFSSVQFRLSMVRCQETSNANLTKSFLGLETRPSNKHGVYLSLCLRNAVIICSK
jgi:hypothetical protein